MSLQGTLKTLGITEVLEFLANRDATGQLDVTTDLGNAVYLFSEGQIAQSEYSFVRETGTDSAEATYYVVSELDGTFFFDEDQEPIDIDSCEPVSSVLGRTADIAEKWLDVEAVIATPDDVLTRNTELDGSVTIQPEWWKALEVIGDGKTSLDVAARLDMGVLDASLLLLAMTNAGLLHVQEPAGLDDSADTELVDHVEYEEAVAPEPEATHAEIEPAPTVVEELAVEPLTMDAPTEEPAPAPVADVAPMPEPAPAPIADVVPMPEPAPAPIDAFAEPAPVVELAPNPVVEAAPVAEAVPAPVANFDPAPAFAEQPATEFVEAAPAPEPVLSAPVPEPVVDEDDGWASNHSPSFEPAPSAAAAFPAPAPAPASYLAAPEPAPVPQPQNTEVFSAMPPAMPEAPQFDPNAQSTAMAGEVLDDLAALGQLDEQPAPANWQLDGTFVADAEPAAPQVDADPFGDLGELLADSDEDRGSVLKFLRRD